MRELIRQKIIDAQTATILPFTRRTIYVPKIKGKAIAVIGPRRGGKTTFLWQTLADRVAAGTDRAGLLYFNFEDERLAEMTANELQWVLEEYYILQPEWRDRQRALFLFDEIQIVRGWEGFTRRILDTESIELFISGSSARMLSREVATNMRGRAMEALVFPFSFRERLRHYQMEPEVAIDRLPKADRSAIEKQMRDYLVEGGFPEAQGASIRDRFELLRSYVDTTLLRDIVERHNISNPTALRWMVRHLLANAGAPFSINKFHRDLHSQGIAVSKETLHAYLEYLEDAFLIRTLSIATDSERSRTANPRKAYPIDPALIPIFDRTSRSNTGHALETVVLLELERRGAQIAYVRTEDDFEVDFLAHYPDGRQELIQVAATIEDATTRQREVRGLLAAQKAFPQASLHLLTLALDGLPDLPAEIDAQRASSWLLQNENL